MSVAGQLHRIKAGLPVSVKLAAVSKFHPVEAIREAYEAGHRLFAENRVQELVEKQLQLPADVEWHFIGHLQANKVKYIVPFVAMIQSVDSEKLLNEIDRCAGKNNRKIKVLLQIHIAQEEHKFGFSFEEAEDATQKYINGKWPNIQICGLMGMATFTENQAEIRKEFASLRSFFNQLKNSYFIDNENFKEISMGMSDDYPVAVEEGSTIVRIGSKIFGQRNY
ncbi:MAG: YggS family pyridoxal phosphate-dependent enzyme [Dysgonamonadaceae bacterium]|jgi:pyridoxal phosphate enzyme (YggS family)|nr:YggS family pyridoxal phosphate-dependent enzyme [Dysgonamonadaceae bacterium]